MQKKIILLIILIAIVITAANYKSIIKKFYPLKYSNYVEKYSTAYNLNKYLVYAMIKVESNFDVDAVSGKGAAGLMQITPKTGKYIADILKDKNYNDNKLNDPDMNIKYGCFYIAKLLNDFNGDINSVLAAYNGGEGNVRKWIKQNNNEELLDIENVPFSETKSYVKKVKMVLKIYRHIYE